MTMTDETEVKAPAKKKRKPQVRAARPADMASPFEGISASNCCDRCHKDKCAISEMNYCAHPFKGGLQAVQMNDDRALKRFNKAKDKLKNQMIELRGR